MDVHNEDGEEEREADDINNIIVPIIYSLPSC